MNTTYDISLSSDAFKRIMMKLSTGIVWKNASRANSNEVDTDPYDSEIFIAANRGLLTFDIVRNIPDYVLRNAGVHENNIEEYSINKNFIPEDLRPAIIAEYTKALTSKDPLTNHYGYNVPIIEDGVEKDNYIEVYHETNSYYRMLMGLPPVDDTDFVYNTYTTKLPLDVPVHLMTLSQRLELEENGYLDQLIAQYPDKKYLPYIGKKSVDYFTSRTADRFDILWITTVDTSSTVQDDFIATYNNNKNLVNRIYYTDAYRKSNSYYDNFLAMCILFMTIQVMNSRYLEKDITRDFYDADSLKVVYDSYGVPFYSEIPLEYHKKIVKNINRLISYKGSTQVFIDLFDLFDLGSIDLYQYYLIKIHKIDSSGNPVFIYEYDEFGNKVLAADQSAAYEIKFAKCKVGEDPALQMADESNYIEYKDIVLSDPYWVLDSDLENKLNEEVFNYNESKYIGIQSVFDLMQLTYENAYAIKMIFDNKDITSNIVVDVNGGTLSASLFDLFIYLGALYCKSKGWAGIITPEAATVSTYLGYNFENNLKELKARNYYTRYVETDREIYDIINNMNITNLTSVNTVFNNILNLRKYIADKICSASTREEFFIYKELYDTLLTSQYVSGIFGLDESSTESTTFEEVLSNTSGLLYSRYLMMVDYTSEIESIVNSIENYIPAMKNLSYALDMDTNTLVDSLFKILNFFKSAKSELVGYDIVYLLTLRGDTYMKYLDQFVSISEVMRAKDEELNLIDIMESESISSKYRSYIQLINDDLCDFMVRERFRDEIRYLTDKIIDVVITYLQKTEEDITLFDIIDPVGTVEYERIVERLSNIEYRKLFTDIIFGYYNYNLIKSEYTFKDSLSDPMDIVKRDIVIIEDITYKDKLRFTSLMTKEIHEKSRDLLSDLLIYIKTDITYNNLSDYIRYSDVIKLLNTTRDDIIEKTTLIDILANANTMNILKVSAMPFNDMLYEK